MVTMPHALAGGHFDLTLQTLLLLRMAVGFSIGGLPVAFTLFTEYCPTSGRGAWLVVLQVFHCPLSCSATGQQMCKM